MVTVKDGKQFKWSPKGDQQKSHLIREVEKHAVAKEGEGSSLS